MLKSLIYITISWIIVLNSMIYSVIKVNFTINQKFIIENFCVNKDKPELKCDGKCFLAQKIQDAKEQQESIPAFTFNKDFGIFLPVSTTLSNVDLIFEPILVHHSFYKVRFGQTTIFSLEHPPQG